MKAIELEFLKDVDLVEYPWEQPDVPFFIRKETNTEAYLPLKLFLDNNKKIVYIKEKQDEDSLMCTIMPLNQYIKNHNTWVGWGEWDDEKVNSLLYKCVCDLEKNLLQGYHKYFHLVFSDGEISLNKI